MKRYVIIPAKQRNATHKNSNGEFFIVIDSTKKNVEAADSLYYDSIDDLIQIEKKTKAPVYKELSKLSIRRKLREIGKEDEFDVLLDSNSQARRDWDDATAIKTNDPMFTIQSVIFKSALGLTDAQFNELLNS